jgi:CO dehydrogenase maturation factor
MKNSVAVAGKGGTGKTTIAALIVNYLKQKGMGPVLVFDADPDANLGTLLGVNPQKSVGDLREEVLKEIKKLPAGMTKANYVESGLHQIIEEAEGFDLITMGRGEGAGCYCSLNNIIRKFSDDLAPSYSWVVIDNEAGLEHISRRTTSNIDTLLVVVSGNPISFDTAKKIRDITSSMNNKIRKLFLVTNMVREDKLSDIHKRIAELEIEHLGDIPHDNVLEDAVFNGDSLLNIEKSTARECVFSIMDKIGGKNGNT